VLDAPGDAVRIVLPLPDGRAVLEGRSLSALDVAGRRGAVAGRPGLGRLALGAAGGEVTLEGQPTGTAQLAITAAGAIAVDGGGKLPVLVGTRLAAHAREDTLLVVAEVPLERYLAGVVPLEMDAGWPLEALKAQAVAARTYAINRRAARRKAGALFDVEATVMDQVYGGATAEDPRAVAAIVATRGEWLADDAGAPILAAFHSTSGGHTESAEAVWGEARPYLVGAACPFDRESPVHTWSILVPVDEVEQRLVAGGYAVTGLRDLVVRSRTASGRARAVDARRAGGETVVVPAGDLRRLLGYGRLKSTAFSVRRHGAALRFDGRGAGHGIGMCQYGARGMALAGRDYRAILAFYYPGAVLATSER
jgi:stage II sporulation protein D